MSNPSRSLTWRLDWRAVFEVIGVDYPNRSDLPQSMPCPLCETGALTVMQDRVLHAEWFHCHGCKFAGDLIELAARVRECSINQIVEILEARQMFEVPLGDDDLTNYQIEHLDYRHRIKVFWEEASRAPAQMSGLGPSGYSLLRKFSLGEHAYREQWQQREGRLFGVAQRQTIVDLFAPSSFEVLERPNRSGNSSRRRGGGPGKRRLFQGHDWDEVLVIPHSDLPGRIIGFTFIGRDPDNYEIIYKRANIGCCVARPRESGLGFLDAIDGSSHPSFGCFAFVFLDEEIATLLHGRHLRESTRPLPILLAKSTRDFNLLNLPPDLAEFKLVFCGPPLKTLPLAKAHNALVSEYQISDLEIRDNLKHRNSTTFLNLFRKRAVPWVSALRQHLTTLNHADLEVLVGRLNLTSDENDALLNGLGGEASERLAHVGPHRIGGKTIEVEGQIVDETAGGWIAKKAGREEVICGWPIRIQTIFKTDAGNTHYEVFVQCPNEPVTLVIAESELKRTNLFDMVACELRNVFNLQFHYIRRKWAKKSFAIAMRFSEPKIVIHSDRIGWCQERQRFQFPQFSILSGGSIDPTPMPIRHADHFVPASALPIPSTGREAVVMLSRCSPETQIIWALAACVAHNLLAGNCVREPLGVVLDGRFARETGVSAATALGCGSVDVAYRGKSSILQFVSTECGAHDFLSVIRFRGNTKPQLSTAWLDDPNLRNAILPLPSYAAIAVSSHRGFVRIRSDEFPQPLGPLSSAAEWIIPAYLEDVCRRKKLINLWVRDNELLSVLSDMAEWLERMCGNPKAVLAGENVLACDTRSPALAFVELAEQMRCAKDIACVEAQAEGAVPAKAPVAIIEHRRAADQPPAVQVRHWVINELLQQKRAPAIRPDDVQADLVTRSAWLGVSPEEQGSSWLIDAGWWNQTIAAVRQNSDLSIRAGSRKGPIDGPSEREFPSQPPSVVRTSTT